MSLRNVPTQVPFIDRNGKVSQPWVLFFSLLAKDVAGWQPPNFADADATENTVYYSTTASKLVYKDSGGTVHNLY